MQSGGIQKGSMQKDSVVAGEVAKPPSVLIVDDEPGIRRSLEGVVSDAGYRAICAADGQSAIAIVKAEQPSVVLLDIWMPGMDGLEILGKLKEFAPDLPVIMISGHATISTAVKATRLGAVDFIEKPLDLDDTVAALGRAIAIGQKKHLDGSREEALKIGNFPSADNLSRVAFSSFPWKGKAIRQKTLSRTGVLYGQGLHSGKKSGLILEPLPAGSGIHFVGIAETTVVPAHVDFVDSTGFATSLRLGATQAGTTEHLLSTLHAFGISNLLVKCNGEVPVMDGSALEFCKLFNEIGIEEQDGEWFEIKIEKTIRVGSDTEYIQIEPADTFSIEYTLNYPKPVGIQHMVYTLGDLKSYEREIAPARTFGFVKDVGYLQKQGLAQGGRFDNLVLFGEDKVINGALRFPDEPVRHKILDAIGDLYLLGRPLKGKVTACMTGHSDNIELLRAIKLAMSHE